MEVYKTPEELAKEDKFPPKCNEICLEFIKALNKRGFSLAKFCSIRCPDKWEKFLESRREAILHEIMFNKKRRPLKINLKFPEETEKEEERD